MKKFLCVLILALVGAATSVFAEESTTETKDYPLTTCVVSGEALGEMGDVYTFEHDGREIRLCCKRCQKKFQKNPEKYLAILDAAAAKEKEVVKDVDAGDAHQHHDATDSN